MIRRRFRFTVRRLMVAVGLVVLALVVWLLPWGGVTWKTYAKLRVGMPELEARAILGGAPDDRVLVAGRVVGLQAPGPEPLKWFWAESWEGPDLTIVVYSEAATDAVVKKDAIDRGSASLVSRWSRLLLKRLPL